MRCLHTNQQRRLTHCNYAKTMYHPNSLQLPLPVRLREQLAKLMLGHLAVGGVLQRTNRFPVLDTAHNSQKRHHPTHLAAEFTQCSPHLVDRFVGEKQFIRGRPIPALQWRHQGQYITVVELA